MTSLRSRNLSSLNPFITQTAGPGCSSRGSNDPAPDRRLEGDIATELLAAVLAHHRSGSQPPRSECHRPRNAPSTAFLIRGLVCVSFDRPLPAEVRVGVPPTAFPLSQSQGAGQGSQALLLHRSRVDGLPVDLLVDPCLICADGHAEWWGCSPRSRAPPAGRTLSRPTSSTNCAR